MTRLVAILGACAMVAAIALAVSWGVQNLMLLIYSHPLPKWMAHSMGGFSAVITGMVVWLTNRRKPKKDDDERLTPLVRRDPVTGVREL